MSIVLVVIYCLVAAALIFGLTFHDELREEKRSQKRKPAPVINIAEGRQRSRILHRHRLG